MAKALSLFTAVNEFGHKELLQATTSKRQILKTLATSKGVTIILDDVKRENVQGQRDHSRIAVDAILRSVFSGCLTEDYAQKSTSVDTCAIITGEYMETSDSQNGRLLYKDVSGFLKDECNSETLRQFQRDTSLIAEVMEGVIVWLCSQLENEDFMERCKEYYYQMQSEKSLYCSLDNGLRLQENYNMMRFVHYIWHEYIISLEFESKTSIAKFNKAAEESLRNLIEDTSLLLGGLKAALVQIIDTILETSNIRKAQYIDEGHYLCKQSTCAWRQSEFCLWNQDDFLYIEDLERSWVGECCQYPVDTREILVISKDKLLDKLGMAVNRAIEQGKIPEHLRDKITLGELARCGLIVCSPREENQYRYAKYYPFAYHNQISLYRDDGYEETARIGTERIMAVQCNLSHECFSGITDKVVPKRMGGMLQVDETKMVKSLRMAFSQGKITLK